VAVREEEEQESQCPGREHQGDDPAVQPESPDPARSTRMSEQRVASVLIGQALERRNDGDEEEEPAGEVAGLPGRHKGADHSEAERDDEVLEVDVPERVNMHPIGEDEDDRECRHTHGEDGRRNCKDRDAATPVLLGCM
jgi:hypothetical protein